MTDNEQYVIKYVDGSYNFGPGEKNGFPVNAREATKYTLVEAAGKTLDLGEVRIISVASSEYVKDLNLATSSTDTLSKEGWVIKYRDGYYNYGPDDKNGFHVPFEEATVYNTYKDAYLKSVDLDAVSIYHTSELQDNITSTLTPY